MRSRIPIVCPVAEAYQDVPVFLTRPGSETTSYLKRASAGSCPDKGTRDSGGGSGDIGTALIVIAILPPASRSPSAHMIGRWMSPPGCNRRHGEAAVGGTSKRRAIRLDVTAVTRRRTGMMR